MTGFFELLFNTEGFPPRWHCGTWSAAHGWVHIIADLAVFGAYTAIPIALAVVAWKRHQEMLFSKIVWLFGAFIFACGSVHLLEAIIFWHPLYRLAGMMKLITALVSWATVILLIRILPQALTLPGLPTVNRRLKESLLLQKRTTAALESAQKRFAALVDNVPGVVFQLRQSDKEAGAYAFTFVSHGTEELFGIPAETLRENADLILTKLRSPSQGDLTEALHGSGLDRAPLSWEGEFRRPDGSHLTIHAQAHVSEAPEGGLLWDGILFDMTELNTARQALDDSEARKLALLEASHDAFLIVDEAHRIVECNPASKRMFDANGEGLLGRPIQDLGVEGIDAGRNGHLKGRQNGNGPARDGEREPHRGVIRLLRGHGKNLTLETAVRPLSLQEGTFHSCHIRDISAQVAAEEHLLQINRSLNEKEERLRLALDTAHAGMWSWRMGEDTVFCDAKLKSILGMEGDPGDTPVDEWRERIHPDDLPRVDEAVQEITEEQTAFDMEYRIVRPNGDTRIVRAQGRFESCQDPAPPRLTGVCIDITERKRNETAILEKNRDLETLLYVTSHDLREPLRAIQNFSRMVLEDHGRELPEDGRDLLERMVRASDRMDGLIDDILMLSRAQRGEITLEPVDGREIVDKAVGELEETILSTGARVEIADCLGVLHVDRTWAAQAVYNLVSNALKFTGNGAVPEIDILPYPSGQGEPSARGARRGIMVRDRGPGVSSDHAERIFRLFQRAVRRKVRGTGAGLAIVRQVAQRHGGRAWVQPRQGGGSEFIITFGEQGSNPNPDGPADAPATTHARETH